MHCVRPMDASIHLLTTKKIALTEIIEQDTLIIALENYYGTARCTEREKDERVLFPLKDNTIGRVKQMLEDAAAVDIEGKFSIWENNKDSTKAFEKLEKYFKKAESKYVNSLQLIYLQQKDTDISNLVAECLLGLATIYRLKTHQSQDLWDFIRADGLANSAQGKASDKFLLDNIEDELGKIEELYKETIQTQLSQEGKMIDRNLMNESIKHLATRLYTEVKKMRKECAHRIKTHEGLEGNVSKEYEERTYISNFNKKDVGNDEICGKEVKFVQMVEAECKAVARDMKSILAKIFNEVLNIMKKAGLDPPCDYALLGLGSFSTETITPYSDFDTALLIEETEDEPYARKYFRILASYMYLLVLSFGETIVPSLGVPSLKVSEDNAQMWFWDDGAMGISFDGAFPWASKTPMTLIYTPSAMAELQHKSKKQANKNYSNAEVYQRYTLICGKQYLVDTYTQELQNIYKKKAKKDLITTLNQLRKAADFFSPHLGSRDDEGALLNVKQGMYRMTEQSLDLCERAISYNEDCTRNISSWDILRGRLGNYLAKEDLHNVKVNHSIACWMRLKSYMTHHRQREDLQISLQIQATTARSNYPVIQKPMIFRFLLFGRGLKVISDTMWRAVFPMRFPSMFVHGRRLPGLPTKFTIKWPPDHDILSQLRHTNELHYTKALVNMRLQDYEEALEEFEVYEKNAGKAVGCSKYRLYHYMAHCSGKLKRPETMKRYEVAVDEIEKHIEAGCRTSIIRLIMVLMDIQEEMAAEQPKIINSVMRKVQAPETLKLFLDKLNRHAKDPSEMVDFFLCQYFLYFHQENYLDAIEALSSALHEHINKHGRTGRTFVYLMVSMVIVGTRLGDFEVTGQILETMMEYCEDKTVSLGNKDNMKAKLYDAHAVLWSKHRQYVHALGAFKEISHLKQKRYGPLQNADDLETCRWGGMLYCHEGIMKNHQFHLRGIYKLSEEYMVDDLLHKHHKFTCSLGPASGKEVGSPRKHRCLLLREISSTTVLVYGFPSGMEKSKVKTVLEGTLTGERIRKIQPIFGNTMALITFANMEIAENIALSYTHYQMNILSLDAYVKMKKVACNTILVSNIPDWVDEAQLKTFFEDIVAQNGSSGKASESERRENVKYVTFQGSNSALIVFEDNKAALEIALMKDICWKWSIYATDRFPPSTVKLNNIIGGIDEEFLAIFFENKRKSGANDVINVTLLPEDRSAFIQFQHRQDAEEVCRRHHFEITLAEFHVEKYEGTIPPQLLLRIYQ